MHRFKVKNLDFVHLAEVAARIVALSEKIKIITFQGELGAGKTTLIKAICLILGIPVPVSSPTFTLINEYRLPDGEPAYHIDMYRLDHELDALEFGITEYTYSGCWCLIEWPEKIASWLPENFVSLKIEADPLNHDRTITLRLPEC